MPRQQAEAELARMIAAVTHESFYVTGTLVDESLGVYAGWVALKGSFSDGMPLRDQPGDVAMLFSGEDYPNPQEASRPVEAEPSAEGKHRPAYLLSGYQQDPAFPAGLNGRFHGIVTDRRRGTALLFNDRYGNGFEKVLLPRYHIPLTPKGALAVSVGMHRGLVQRIPKSLLTRLLALRRQWYAWKIQTLEGTL